MKKKILVTLAVLSIGASVGYASPLTDYSVGKTTIDLMVRNTDSEVTDREGPISLGRKSNLDFGITTGLGNRLAIQYSNYNAKAKDAVFYSSASETDRMNGKLKTQEFNIMYKVDKNISAYTGLVTIKGSLIENDRDNGTNIDTTYPYSSGTKKKMQFGLVGSTKLGEKTSAYAQVGVASDYTNWKIGVSQEIAPNLDFNIDYRRLKVKKLSYEAGDASDVTVKGLGYGVTYKF